MVSAGMDGKVVMVTGASSGIGEAATLELAKMGASVVMVSRSESRGRAALERIKKSGNESVTLKLADLSSIESVRSMAESFQAEHTRLDVLVNNAGLFNLRRRVTPDGYESTFEVNYLSQFLLTNLLLPQLEAAAPSRVVNTASDAHYGGRVDFDNLQGERGFSGWAAYSNSKMEVVLFTKELARKVKGKGVTANCLHPGVVATNIFKRGAGPLRPLLKVARLFLLSPKSGADTLVYLASSPEMAGTTGEYFYKRRVRRSAEDTYDEELASRLWTKSEELVKQAPVQALR